MAGKGSLMLLGHVVMLLSALVFTPPSWAGEAADANLTILRDTIRSNKKALVAVNLGLTDTESQQFWPVYDRYQGELAAINDRLVRLIQDYTASYGTLTDAHATQLVEQYLAVEDDRAKLRRSYAAEFGKTLPGRKVARFYQIENKMDAVIRHELAETIPVAE